jgi:hypothetical protein
MEIVRGAGLISIIGMHRSGTSALAGALHKMGADLGRESSWRRPAADNPRGFFEHAAVVDLNNDVFAAFGGTWSSPPPLPPGWVEDERLDELRDRAEQLAAEMSERMVVKDPRLSLVQPLWENIGNVSASVLCLRHPAAVANSLLVRNRFTIDQSLFLSFRYNAAATLNCPEALVVEYESLVTDPVPQLTRVANHIGLEVSTKTVEAAAGTVHRSMVHHESSELPESPIGVMCRRLYELLRSGEPLEKDHAVWLWARLVTELPWAGPGEREILRAQRDVAQSRLEIDRLIEEKEAADRRLQRIETELRHALKAVDMSWISETAAVVRSERGEL